MSPLRHSDPGLLRASVRATSSLLALRQAGYRKAGGDGNRAKVAAEWRERTWLFRRSMPRSTRGPWDAPLDAVRLVRACDVIDLHIDTFIPPRLWGYDPLVRHRGGPLGRFFFGHLDVPRMSTAVSDGAMWSITTNPFRGAARALAGVPAEPARACARSSRAPPGRLARGAQPRRRIARRAPRGAHACLLAIQGLNALEGAPDGVLLASRRRHRPCHARPPDERRLWRDLEPARRRRAGDKGLTPAGREAVAQLNARRIFVDLAHVHERTFWDVVAVHDRSQPLLVTHTGVTCGAPALAQPDGRADQGGRRHGRARSGSSSRPVPAPPGWSARRGHGRRAHRARAAGRGRGLRLARQRLRRRDHAAARPGGRRPLPAAGAATARCAVSASGRSRRSSAATSCARSVSCAPAEAASAPRAGACRERLAPARAPALRRWTSGPALERGQHRGRAGLDVPAEMHAQQRAPARREQLGACRGVGRLDVDQAVRRSGNRHVGDGIGGEVECDRPWAARRCGAVPWRAARLPRTPAWWQPRSACGWPTRMSASRRWRRGVRADPGGDGDPAATARGRELRAEARREVGRRREERLPGIGSPAWRAPGAPPPPAPASRARRTDGRRADGRPPPRRSPSGRPRRRGRSCRPG